MCIQLNIENMKLTMSSSMSGIFDWLCSMFKGSIVVSIEFMYWNAQFWDEDKVYWSGISGYSSSLSIPVSEWN